jgi:hypothetical protein
VPALLQSKADHMPFPTSVLVSRTVRPSPPAPPEALVEGIARELRQAQVPGVSPGRAAVRFDARMAEARTDVGTGGSALFSSGEVEVIDRGHEVELVAEAQIGRLPLAFGTGTLVAVTMAGGLHTISLAGGLIGGALIAVVPWVIARVRLAAMLARVAQDAEAGRLPPVETPPALP